MKNLVASIRVGGGSPEQESAVRYFKLLLFSVIKSDDIRDQRLMKGDKNMDVTKELRNDLKSRMMMGEDIYLDSDNSTLKHRIWLHWVARKYGYKLSFCILRQSMEKLAEAAGCDLETI